MKNPFKFIKNTWKNLSDHSKYLLKEIILLLILLSLSFLQKKYAPDNFEAQQKRVSIKRKINRLELLKKTEKITKTELKKYEKEIKTMVPRGKKRELYRDLLDKLNN